MSTDQPREVLIDPDPRARYVDGRRVVEPPITGPADTRTPAERRGYPLPPWVQVEAPVEHTGADVLEWLLDLCGITDEDHVDGGVDYLGASQAEAYLDAWLARHREAQDTASRCVVEDHDGAVRYVADARADALAAHGRVRELERTVVTQAEAYRALEELYVATHRPAVLVATELDEDRDRWEIIRVALAFDRIGGAVSDLSAEARGRITEAAATAAHQAYERERSAGDRPARSCGLGCPCDATS